MSDEIEWGLWQNHNGKGCPCAGRLAQWEIDGCRDFVGVTDKNGFTMIAPGIIQGLASNGPAWEWANGVIPVIRYRIRKPRSTAMDRLAEIARDPKAPIAAPEGPVRTPEHIA